MDKTTIQSAQTVKQRQLLMRIKKHSLLDEDQKSTLLIKHLLQHIGQHLFINISLLSCNYSQTQTQT